MDDQARHTYRGTLRLSDHHPRTPHGAGDVSYVEEVAVAVERMTPRGRSDYATIPDGDYRKEYALLIGEVHAAAEESDTWTADQRAGMNEVVQPALTAVRDFDDKLNMRGLLAIRIAEARQAFRQVMGEHWMPRPDNTVARAAEARGLTL